MTPTPQQLRLCAFLMENPDVPCQLGTGSCADEIEWHDIAFRDDVWWAIKQYDGLRIHPDYNPPEEATWEKLGDNPEVVRFTLEQKDKYGVILSEDEEFITLQHNGGKFSLCKLSGKVTKLSQTEL